MQLINGTINAWKFGSGRIHLAREYIYTQPYQSIRTPPNIHVVNRLNIQLGAKMGTEIYRYQRVVVLALLTLVEIFIILGFHEVLIY